MNYNFFILFFIMRQKWPTCELDHSLNLFARAIEEQKYFFFFFFGFKILKIAIMFKLPIL